MGGWISWCSENRDGLTSAGGCNEDGHLFTPYIPCARFAGTELDIVGLQPKEVRRDEGQSLGFMPLPYCFFMPSHIKSCPMLL